MSALTGHSLWNHIFAPIWTRIPEKLRWRIVHRLDASRRRCWADLVDDALTYRESDACDTKVPSLRPDGATTCRTVCGWSHPTHEGEHGCSCYCGKFQFVAAVGASESTALAAEARRGADL